MRRCAGLVEQPHIAIGITDGRTHPFPHTRSKAFVIRTAQIHVEHRERIERTRYQRIVEFSNTEMASDRLETVATDHHARSFLQSCTLSRIQLHVVSPKAQVAHIRSDMKVLISP
ncbi:MAG: hypothetical protein IPN38_11625 [Flavobacteriales bacterium]|nr:hypothetical protein [Flavobacteriales bacterium]